MIIDTGLSVTRRTWFRIASPLFGSLVSTSTTPASVTNTDVFPPAPGITYRLSRTFLIAPVGGTRGRCCCAAAPANARPATTIAGRSLLRVIGLFHSQIRQQLRVLGVESVERLGGRILPDIADDVRRRVALLEDGPLGQALAVRIARAREVDPVGRHPVCHRAILLGSRRQLRRAAV